MISIQIHSVTDLITNSSTVIYTYSANCVEACEKMINAILKALGNTKTCSDMFTLAVYVDPYKIHDKVYDLLHGSAKDDEEEGDEEEDEEDAATICTGASIEGLPADYTEKGHLEQMDMINTFVRQIAEGTISEPSWLTDLATEEDSDGYNPNTTLSIFPKAPEYEEAAEAIRSFLYSTGHEATYG